MSQWHSFIVKKHEKSFEEQAKEKFKKELKQRDENLKQNLEDWHDEENQGDD